MPAKLTPTQKGLLGLIGQTPGITLQNAAVQMNTSAAGAGIAATRLVAAGLVRREKDNLFPAESKPVVTTPDHDYDGIPPQAAQFVRDFKSKIAIYHFSEDDATDKRAGYLAKVGLLAIIKDLTGTPE